MATRQSRKGLWGLVFILAALVALVLYVNPGKKISHPVRELAMAPETIGGFGVEGTGGDPALNKEKNRFTAPLDVADLSVASVISLPSSALAEAGRSKRERWPAGAVNAVEEEEHLGIRITGYLVHAKESGPESCNGYSDSLRDYHIWVSDVPVSDKSNAMIVEITPRWKAIRPEWRLHVLERLSQEHARVRVTGWLMWDEEHPDEVGKSRATQWEIHPVTNFEVYSGGGWIPLSSP